MYRFVPINGPLFRPPFPARVNFRPSKGPFILGLLSRIWLVKVRYWPVLFVGQIQPVVTFGPFVARYPVGLFSCQKNPLGCFHRVIKYGLLAARYGP